MKRAVIAVALLLCASPVRAQAPAGWQARVDRSANAADPDGAGGIQFMAMGGGFHVVAPAAGVFWQPAQAITGNYTLKGTFTLNAPSDHNNYYGLVFGAASLDGPRQNYLYFLVAQDGTYLVKHRAGDSTTHVVKDKTSHASVNKPDGAGKSVNALEVRVAADRIDYVVNGTVVHSTPKSGMTSRTDGAFGFRINHRLNVTVTGFSAAKAME